MNNLQHSCRSTHVYKGWLALVYCWMGQTTLHFCTDQFYSTLLYLPRNCLRVSHCRAEYKQQASHLLCPCHFLACNIPGSMQDPYGKSSWLFFNLYPHCESNCFIKAVDMAIITGEVLNNVLFNGRGGPCMVHLYHSACKQHCTSDLNDQDCFQ